LKTRIRRQKLGGGKGIGGEQVTRDEIGEN